MDLCKGCGKRIVWGIHEGTGTRIPLDPVAPVYEAAGASNKPDKSGLELYVSRTKTAFVSHFATCAKANQFSGKNANQQSLGDLG